MSSINNILNKVHELGQPEQSPLSRLGSTRLWSIACAALEVTSLACTPWYIGVAGIQYFAKTFQSLTQKTLAEEIVKKDETSANPGEKLKQSCIQTAKIIAGLASTLLFGIIFCPELNFRIHLRLGLAVDNFSVKKQKELEAKLTAEARAKEIAQGRAERFAAFEAKRDAQWAADWEQQTVDSRLADLILLNTA